jgi:hypothetical protein
MIGVVGRNLALRGGERGDDGSDLDLDVHSL